MLSRADAARADALAFTGLTEGCLDDVAQQMTAVDGLLTRGEAAGRDVRPRPCVWSVAPFLGGLCISCASVLVRPEVATAQVTDPSRDSTAYVSAARQPLLRKSDLALVATFLGSFLLITPLEDFEEFVARDVATEDRAGFRGGFFKTGRVIGSGWFDYSLAGVVLAAGGLTGSSTVTRIGLRSLESLLVADGIGTAFKMGVGRRRPDAARDPDTFRPFTSSRRQFSFPSGHTAHVFALAATLSREFEGDPWVPYVAYPIATATALSRVVGRKHWVTDVVAGAAVGIFSSRLVGRLNGDVGRERLPRLEIASGPDGGFTIPLR